LKGRNNWQQATSNKQQATSNKQQATSNKQPATSNKHPPNQLPQLLLAASLISETSFQLFS
jgi:hypothetical protein